MEISVYCSSSNAVPANYLQAAHALGREMGVRKHALVYGGASVGSMGEVARGVKEAGGRVIGVLPARLQEKGVAFPETDEEIVTGTMRERKRIMEERADGFIALPGGLGTLEEIIEVMVLKQLRFHERAVVFLDVDGFYSSLFAFFEQLYREQFMKESTRTQYTRVDDAATAIDYLENYRPRAAEEKLF